MPGLERDVLCREAAAQQAQGSVLRHTVTGRTPKVALDEILLVSRPTAGKQVPPGSDRIGLALVLRSPAQPHEGGSEAALYGVSSASAETFAAVEHKKPR
jgi:hypothetical protein